MHAIIDTGTLKIGKIEKYKEYWKILFFDNIYIDRDGPLSMFIHMFYEMSHHPNRCLILHHLLCL